MEPFTVLNENGCRKMGGKLRVREKGKKAKFLRRVK